MDNPYSPSLIPVYIEAKTKDELMKKMFQTNLLNGKMYNFQTPMKDGKKWVVWYYADITRDQHLDMEFNK